MKAMLLAFFQRVSRNQSTTALFSFSYSVVLFICCICIYESWQGVFFNFAVCIFGAILGWITGIVISPYDGEEKNRFASVGQTVSAFLSGYFISKLDQPVTALVIKISKNISDGAYDTISDDMVFKFRVIAFFTSFFVSMITLYVFRVYHKPGANEEPPQPPTIIETV